MKQFHFVLIVMTSKPIANNGMGSIHVTKNIYFFMLCEKKKKKYT